MTDHVSTAKVDFDRTIQDLENASSPTEADEILSPWLDRGDMIYALGNNAFLRLRDAARNYQLWNLWSGLASSLENHVETLPETRERRAGACSKTLEAIADPQALVALGEAEWREKVATAHETRDQSLVRRLHDARRSARDAQPHLTAAHGEVQAVLNNPEVLLKLSKQDYSAILKMASIIPHDYGGMYNNYRQSIISAKTKAIISARISSTPSSDIMHLGIRGAFTLELVRRVDRIITAYSWCTAPRVFAPIGRKPLVFMNGEPETGYAPCDSSGSFYKMPDVRERSTSIVCRRKDAALLKIHGETLFDVNIDDDLESFFRSKSKFPWECEEQAQ
jgi:hypothetical protein